MMIKKLFVFLLLGIFLISFVSAFEFDNVKNSINVNKGDSFQIGEKEISYKTIWEKYKPLEIKNCALWIGVCLIEGETLFRGAITKHTETCGENCMSEIELEHSGGVLIQEINFYTIKEDGSRIKQDIRSYQFYIGEERYYVGQELEPGNYKLRLNAKKKPSRTVDWVIKTHGKTLNSWATWGGPFLKDIFAYYTLDDDLPTTNILDSHNFSNGTLLGGDNTEDISVIGKINTALHFNGVDDVINLSTIMGTFVTNFTISVWFKTDDDPTTIEYIYSRREGAGVANENMFALRFANNDDLLVQHRGTFFLLQADIDQNWHHVVFVQDSTQARFYVDNVNVLNQSGVIVQLSTLELFLGAVLPGQNHFDGTIDEFGIWNRSLTVDEVSSLYNSGNGFAYPFGTGNLMTLNSPNNGSIVTINEVTFNCSAQTIEGVNITNMSLFTNGGGTWEIKNTTTGIDSSFSTQTWTRTFSNENTIIWNCQGCDSDEDCGFSVKNFTVIIDISPPTIEVENPNGTLGYNLIGGNETLNVTFTDVSLDSCWYNYNGTNITIGGCLTGVKNSTKFILEENNFNMTLYANDTLGNENSTFINWSYKVLEINQTFNNITTEGATEQFTINFTKASNLQVSTVNLIYNETSNSFPYSVSGNNIISSSSITIPTVTLDINVTFYWNITLDDGSSITTQSNNQTIKNVNIDDCSSFTNLVYNFTQYDEENQTILSGNNTIELQINLYDLGKNIILIKFSNTFTGINPVQVCLENPILPTVNYSSYVIVKYFANNTNTNESYSVEYYNILNQTISNTTIPINIALYNLKVSDTTKFRLTFRDGSYVLAPNILVQVHRQYIRDNDFKIVEIPLTDSNGQTVLNLVKDTIVYNFIMVNEAREIVGTFNSIIAFCSDFLIGDCNINLAPDSLSEDIYDYNEEFDISISNPSYDNITKKISISFVTGDLTPKNVRMEIVRNNNFGNRSVCSDSLFAASGLLSCDVSAITDTDQFLFISTLVEGDLAKQDTINLNADILNFGTLNGAFFAFLLILFLITMFMEDRKVLIISLGLGWVGVISLGLVSGRFIGFTSAGIWILITIGIFLWKLNEEESS